ncbi:MAG: dihydroorotate dehydrogenase-like protein [Actinobacteria bacterium]|nr:dihydroorotate dehydrogenase-like protein [Actinomycetota bacterium]
MADLKTSYMGINLRNPLIIGASSLTYDLEDSKKIEEAGAAAVVFKSLFEEQIELESLQLQEQAEEYSERNAEMISIYPKFKHAGARDHLNKLKKLKEVLKIPVIASLNALSEDTWVRYAKKIEETGVDGIELNLYSVPTNISKTSNEIEKEHIEIIKAIKKEISIPISVKLSFFYSNILNVISRMNEAGASGFVLFNKLFQPEIDITKQEYTYPVQVSYEHENKIPLRWTGIIYGNINADICSSGGIYTGNDAIKMILSGASCIQSVSTFFKNGINYISNMINDINSWMDIKGYEKISDFKGKLSKKSIKDPFFYGRSQYINILLNNETIIKKYFMI